MSNLPQISERDLQSAVPGLERAVETLHGGQKLVFDAVVRGTRCALKILRSQPDDWPRRSQADDGLYIPAARARREVRLMARLESPHVVRAGPLPLTRTEIGGHDVLYFTEEWIDGRDLHTILQDGPLSPAEVARLGRDVADAVRSLWANLHIHRDIKPENIMYRESGGEYVLVDMGTAFDLDDISLSMVGSIPGTDIYYSPEQIDYTAKRRLDFRSDLFALGIVMYEAVTGEHPFWKEDLKVHEVLAGILETRVPAPSKLRPEVPPALDAIILKLLHKRRSRRYASCEDLIRALDRLEGLSGLECEKRPPP